MPVWSIIPMVCTTAYGYNIIAEKNYKQTAQTPWGDSQQPNILDSSHPFGLKSLKYCRKLSKLATLKEIRSKRSSNQKLNRIMLALETNKPEQIPVFEILRHLRFWVFLDFEFFKILIRSRFLMFRILW
jgi:hypothetical protein